LNNRFNALQRSIENGDARPTDAAYVVYDELSEELEKHMAKLHSALEKELPKVNAMLEDNGISTIEAR
jgi:DNA polymerase I-like protein with 3'-5' exonuclease and polymerase domains